MEAAWRALVLLAAILAPPPPMSGGTSTRMINLVVPGVGGDTHLMFLAGGGKAPSVSIHRHATSGKDSQSDKTLMPERFENLWRRTQVADLVAFAGPEHEHRLGLPPHYTLMIGATNEGGLMDIKHYRIPTCGAGLEEQHAFVRELARDLLPAAAIDCIAGAGERDEDE